MIIRADASAQTGSGHVMRCLALAQGLYTKSISVVFAYVEMPPTLLRRIELEGHTHAEITGPIGSRYDTSETLRCFFGTNATWIIADGYNFGSEWQKTVREAGARLLLLDDYGHTNTYYADIILNQNAYVCASLYARRDASTRLLLGNTFTLLRRDFLTWRKWKREIPAKAVNVLVTLGGSDPANITSAILKELQPIQDIEVMAVIGAANPHRSALEALIEQLNTSRSWLKLVVNTDDMPGLMAWADVGITAGGSTLWEIAFMGLPALVFVIADNQRPTAEGLASAEIIQLSDIPRLATNLTALLLDSHTRTQMSQHGRRLIDGLGVARVIAELEAA